MAELFVFPFFYLYLFTSATCWFDLLEKYAVIGAFTLGKSSSLEIEAGVKNGLMGAAFLGKVSQFVSSIFICEFLIAFLLSSSFRVATKRFKGKKNQRMLTSLKE